MPYLKELKVVFVSLLGKGMVKTPKTLCDLKLYFCCASLDCKSLN